MHKISIKETKDLHPETIKLSSMTSMTTETHLYESNQHNGPFMIQISPNCMISDSNLYTA